MDRVVGLDTAPSIYTRLLLAGYVQRHLAPRSVESRPTLARVLIHPILTGTTKLARITRTFVDVHLAILAREPSRATAGHSSGSKRRYPIVFARLADPSLRIGLRHLYTRTQSALEARKTEALFSIADANTSPSVQADIRRTWPDRLVVIVAMQTYALGLVGHTLGRVRHTLGRVRHARVGHVMRSFVVL